MKILLLFITLSLSFTALFAQLENFDGFGYTSDSTYIEEDNILAVRYYDSNGQVMGSLAIMFREDNSIWGAGTMSHKGTTSYEFNEKGDVIFEKIEHLEREFIHEYSTYEYTDIGQIFKVERFDSLKSLKGWHEFAYLNDNEQCTEAWEYDKNGDLTLYETYSYEPSGELGIKNQYNGDYQLIGQHVSPLKSYNGKEHFYAYIYNDDKMLSVLRYAELDEQEQPVLNTKITFQYENGEVITFTEDDQAPKPFKGNDHMGAVKTYRFALSHSKTVQDKFK